MSNWMPFDGGVLQQQQATGASLFNDVERKKLAPSGTQLFKLFN